MGSQIKKWPIEPLVRYVNSTHANKSVGRIARENGLSDGAADKLGNYYTTGIREGFITLKMMDTICIEVLGVHPVEVYGMDYFSSDFDGPRPVKPCRKCKGPKTFGDNAYCESCRDALQRCGCGCGEYKVGEARKRKYAQTCKTKYPEAA